MKTTKKKKLLIVDDDSELLSVLTSYFEENGFDVVAVNSGEKALVCKKIASPDLVLLDLDLPGMNGYEVIDYMRRDDCCTPIILMTGFWNDSQSKIKGYTLGAIQFLDKPVQVAVLLAQINGMLYKKSHERTYVVGENSFIFSQLKLTCGSQTIELTQREADVMEILLEFNVTTVPRNALLKRIWGHDDPRNGKLLDNLIYQLRSKLTSFPQLTIRSYYGKGYRLNINEIQP